jgi:hypothetical protein
MNVGDAVVIKGDGQFDFVPNDGRADQELQHGQPGNRLLGVVVDVREPQDDSLIKIAAPASNVEPPLTTLGTLKKHYA